MSAPVPRRAFILALCGFALLSVGDAVVKSMAGQWPATGVSALRYTMGAVGLAVLVGLRHGRAGFRVPDPWLQLGRGAAVSVSTVCFFLGAMAMPLADATAIIFCGPMLTALLSRFVLKEPAPKAVWGASALAFVGVLVVLRPNLLTLGPAALYPLGAAVGMAWLIILNRKAGGSGASVLTMQLLVAAPAAPMLITIAALTALTGAPEFQLPPPSWEVVGKCLLVACTATTAHLLIYAATLRASAAVVAPMTYVQLLVAAGLGWIWFGNALDLATLGGAALIVTGGLWLWRSQRRPDLGEAPS